VVEKYIYNFNYSSTKKPLLESIPLKALYVHKVINQLVKIFENRYIMFMDKIHPPSKMFDWIDLMLVPKYNNALHVLSTYAKYIITRKNLHIAGYTYCDISNNIRMWTHKNFTT